jgi:hypothetical protein
VFTDQIFQLLPSSNVYPLIMYTVNHPRRRQAEAALGFGCPFFTTSAAPEDREASISSYVQPWGNGPTLHKSLNNFNSMPTDWMEGGQDISNGNLAYAQPSAVPKTQTDKASTPGHVISPNTTTLSIGPDFSFDDWFLTENKVQNGQQILSDEWEVNHASKIASLPVGLDLAVDFGVAIQPMPMNAPPLDDSVPASSLPSASVPGAAAVSTISDLALRSETRRKSKSYKKQRIELHHQSKAEKEPLFGRYRFRIDSDAPTKPEYSRTVSVPDRQHQKALKEQGGGCLRCQIGHKKVRCAPWLQ